MGVLIAGPLPAVEHHYPGHPERPERVAAVLDGLDDLHLGTDLKVLDPMAAQDAEVTQVHSPQYLDDLREAARLGRGHLDADTFVTSASWEAALLVAGAGLDVTRSLPSSGQRFGFVIGRPPGHHALRDRAMGFCLLNNVAIAAADLTRRNERVVIIDWDVHHGNGTQAIFWDDPMVLYVSLHQYPLYPGTGSLEETGGPGAPGSTINIPLPPGATGDVARRALDEVVAPAVGKFRPTWVLVSSGFDAHARDPLAELAWSSGDFGALASGLAQLSTPGHLALFLEGGYDRDALRASTGAVIASLLSVDEYRPEAETTGGPGMDVVRAAAARHAG